jgi:hypothetical protein
LLASHTGWSYDFINRRLPLALGMQIILLHDLREGRPMVWSQPMRGDAGRASVDIAAQIQTAIDNASESSSKD